VARHAQFCRIHCICAGQTLWAPTSVTGAYLRSVSIFISRLRFPFPMCQRPGHRECLPQLGRYFCILFTRLCEKRAMIPFSCPHRASQIFNRWPEECHLATRCNFSTQGLAYPLECPREKNVDFNKIGAN